MRWHRAVYPPSTTRAWPITRLAPGLHSQRTAVQVRDFLMFDVVVRCRNSFRHGINIRHCVRSSSPDPAQPSAFLRKKWRPNSCAPVPGQHGRIRLPPDLPRQPSLAHLALPELRRACEAAGDQRLSGVAGTRKRSTTRGNRYRRTKSPFHWRKALSARTGPAASRGNAAAVVRLGLLMGILV
jgi:hypothetical protein